MILLCTCIIIAVIRFDARKKDAPVQMRRWTLFVLVKREEGRPLTDWVSPLDVTVYKREEWGHDDTFKPHRDGIDFQTDNLFFFPTREKGEC